MIMTNQSWRENRVGVFVSESRKILLARRSGTLEIVRARRSGVLIRFTLECSRTEEKIEMHAE